MADKLIMMHQDEDKADEYKLEEIEMREEAMQKRVQKIQEREGKLAAARKKHTAWHCM